MATGDALEPGDSFRVLEAENSFRVLEAGDSFRVLEEANLDGVDIFEAPSLWIFVVVSLGEPYAAIREALVAILAPTTFPSLSLVKVLLVPTEEVEAFASFNEEELTEALLPMCRVEGALPPLWFRTDSSD